MRRYPAKILLFGEHVLLLGAPALALPVPAFGGQWAWRDAATPPNALDRRLREFAASPAVAAVPGLDAAAFVADLERGLYFPANIPTGYGLGSSGALCAAVYDRYVAQKTTDVAHLQKVFASLESFFHGRSSGLDPLTSFLNRPVVVRQEVATALPGPLDWPDAPVIFLIDSGLPRRTGPLVAEFQQRSREPAIAQVLHETYLPAHAAALAAWQRADQAAFGQAMRTISRIQYEKLSFLIPPTVLELWAQTLHTGTVSLKICGAGGGGFVLGLAPSRAAAELPGCSLPLIFPFAPERLAHEPPR